MAKRHYDFWTKFSYSGYSERDWKKDDPSPFSFFFQKVKFWGLIFQSGPRNRESTFWKTAAVKSEKVKFLPFCHCTLRSDWSTRRNWTNCFYFLHRKRSSKFMSYYLTKWLLQKTYVNIQGDPKGSERFFKNECGIQMRQATPTKFSMLFKHSHHQLF